MLVTELQKQLRKKCIREVRRNTFKWSNYFLKVYFKPPFTKMGEEVEE